MIEISTRIQPGSLLKQEVKAREKGIQVARRLVQEIEMGGVVNEYLADQIVIFMALATSGINPPIAVEHKIGGGTINEEGEGKRRCEILVGREISLHTKTAMRIAEIMLGNVVFSTEKVDEGVLMVCEKKIE